MEFIELDERTKSIIVILSLFLLFAFLFSVMQQRVWGFGDESYYILAAKEIIRTGNPFPEFIPQLYSTGANSEGGEWLAKPVLSYWIPAFFYIISSGNITSYLIFPLYFLFILLVFLFWYLKDNYGFEISVLTIILVLSIPIISHFSVLAYIDVPAMAFFTMAIFTTHKAICTQGKKWIMFSSVSIALAILTKILAVVLLPALLVYLMILFLTSKTNFKTWFKVEKPMIKTILTIFVLSILFISPHFIRNIIVFQNPVFPEIPSFGNYYRVDKDMYEIHGSRTPYASAFDILKFELLYPYVGVALFFCLFGLFYFVLNKSRDKLYFLTMLAVSFMPIFFITSRDVRYIMHLFPLLAFMASYSIYNSLKGIKHSNIFIYVLIFALTLNILIVLPPESVRVVNLRPNAPFEDGQNWIIHNTAKDSVILDLFTPNTLLYLDENDADNERTITFMHPFTGYDIWDFWERDYDDALERLGNHGIDYIVVQKHFLMADISRLAIWTKIPMDFVMWTEGTGIVNPVYVDDSVIIYNVRYI